MDKKLFPKNCFRMQDYFGRQHILYADFFLNCIPKNHICLPFSLQLVKF